MEKLNDIWKKSTWRKKMELLRVANGWSLDEAAERCGTSKRIYWNWERGKSVPIKNNRKIISSVFDVDVNELFLM